MQQLPMKQGRMYFRIRYFRCCEHFHPDSYVSSQSHVLRRETWNRKVRQQRWKLFYFGLWNISWRAHSYSWRRATTSSPKRDLPRSCWLLENSSIVPAATLCLILSLIPLSRTSFACDCAVQYRV